MKRATFILAVIVVVVFSTACMGANNNSLAGKKLIEYGWDVPTTETFRLNYKKMEAIHFDGVVVNVMLKDPKSGSVSIAGWQAFSSKKFQPKELDSAIADLKAVKSTQFTDNFICMTSLPGDVDWFDPQWSSVAYNAGLIARVAKLGGCKGIMFDPEDYKPHHNWTYSEMSPKQRKAHSLVEYSKMARQRGREFMQAINKEYPDITILTLFGPSIAESGLKYAKGNKEKAGYYLYMSFLDGIMDVATPGTTITDGWEFSYGYREQQDFKDVRHTILDDAKKLSQNPKAYQQHIRVGDAVWADASSNNIGWHPDDFSKNFHTPAGFRAALAFAMQTSDKYTWVYSEKLLWWNFDVPAPYVEAIALAHQGPGPGEPNKIPIKNVRPLAEIQKGYSDAETFAYLAKRDMTEIYDFPKDGWLFKAQGKESGQTLGWYKTDFNDGNWTPICIGKWWDEQGVTLEGTGWYRIKFKAPERPAGKKIYLAFGAVDEAAWVWLNGVQLGAHDIGPDGWDKSFNFDITRALEPGQENTLTVRVRNDAGAGGIWKSVKIFALNSK